MRHRITTSEDREAVEAAIGRQPRGNMRAERTRLRRPSCLHLGLCQTEGGVG